MKAKLKYDEESSAIEHQLHTEEAPKRINLNDLIKRSKEEKSKLKKTNVLIFSAVLFSTALVVVIISYL